jgi:PAS domain S-box-containing protein
MSDDPQRGFASPPCFAHEQVFDGYCWAKASEGEPTGQKGHGMNLDNLAQTLLEAMPDGLLVTDADGVVQHWNAGAERIFGFSAAEAVGQSLDLIIPEKQRPRHWDGYRETMRTGRTKYGAGELLSVPALHKEEQRLSIQFSIIPLRAGDGSMAGMASIIRDVTADFAERKRLAKAAHAGSAGST